MFLQYLSSDQGNQTFCCLMS